MKLQYNSTETRALKSGDQLTCTHYHNTTEFAVQAEDQDGHWLDFNSQTKADEETNGEKRPQALQPSFLKSVDDFVEFCVAIAQICELQIEEGKTSESRTIVSKTITFV